MLPTLKVSLMTAITISVRILCLMLCVVNRVMLFSKNNNNNAINKAPKALASEVLAAGQSWMLIKNLMKEVSLDLNADSESALITVSGNEFQTVGAEQRKARLAKSVLANGLSSSGTADDRSVRSLNINETCWARF